MVQLTQNEKKKLKMSLRCLYLVLALLPLLVAATYTWFSLTRTPKVSEMGMSVSCGSGLELAFEADSEEWTQFLDYNEHLEEMAPLKPVTWSEAQQTFIAAEFGLDGRISGITKTLTDEANANHTGTDSYYLKQTCYARTGESVSVSLTPPVVDDEGTKGSGTYVVGTPIWDETSILHENGGSGAEFAIRIGLRITKYQPATGKQVGDSVFYIYEPNCDGHENGTENLVQTPSIDGTETLVPDTRLIQQTASSWDETYPIERDVVIWELGEFMTDTYLFDLEPTEYAQIDIYVWLEGQDVDCTNEIGAAAQILLNLQFKADMQSQSGMEEIK